MSRLYFGLIWLLALSCAAAAVPSSTTLSTSPTGLATFGQPVNLTATVAPSIATGKVTFYDGVTFLGVGMLVHGQASLSTTFIAAGHRSLTAFYSGDGTHGSSVSMGVALTVNPVASLTFAAAPGTPTAVQNQGFMAIGDFNGDGKPDLAVVDSVDSLVRVFLGNGTGGFTEATGSPYATSYNPTNVAVGDFNGDGNQDLAITTANGGLYQLTVLLGNGSGSFAKAAGSPFALGGIIQQFVVGDFNGDGKADLAVSNDYTSIAILLGTGDGGFSAATSYPTGAGPYTLAVGDFNNDGKADIAVANNVGGGVTILLGNGTGGFTTATGSPFVSGVYPISLAVGDFNGDGMADLAISGDIRNASLTILLGNGTGGFTEAPGNPILLEAYLGNIVVADFNGDGKADLAVASQGSVHVLLGDGSGGFTQGLGSPLSVPNGGWQLLVADFNGDGRADLVGFGLAARV